MPEPTKKIRPIVPFLRLENDGREGTLVGRRCKNCGAVYFGARVACAKCTEPGPFEEIPLSRRGTLWTYSIVHQSFPGIPTPYVAAIVDLPEGISVRCNLVDVEPDPKKIRFGMPVEMITRKVREDKDGNDVIAFFFRPVPETERSATEGGA
ncbi:MAG: transcriptional regulator [Candidatus Binatia bacterium]|nr:MAG: transcriptional regulator [Candidatus Binatia bacterium]